jgi:hypothetical protein
MCMFSYFLFFIKQDNSSLHDPQCLEFSLYEISGTIFHIS